MQAIKPLITSPTILGASREIQCFLQIRTFGDGQVARPYERLPETLAGLHYLAFVILMLKNVAEILA
jgi:hypothetical protein